jgi:cytochrome oxidase Cu insertion factor (SCO1/SenC/PrrC family)
MTERKNLSGKIQLAILVIFVIFMPLGSWYYLQSGHNYHKNLMSELKDYGKIPEFELPAYQSGTLSISDLAGKITVTNFFNSGVDSANPAFKYAGEILGQFKGRDDLNFLFFSLDTGIQSDSSLQAFVAKANVKDTRAHFLYGDHERISDLLKTSFRLPSLEERNEDGYIRLSEPDRFTKEYPYFVLADTSLTIRNYYDATDKSSVTRLIEHLAIILPREKKGKAEHIPQKEK